MEAVFDCLRVLESSLKTELPKEVKVEKRRSLFDYQASKGSEVEEDSFFSTLAEASVGEEEDLSSSPIKKEK